MMILIKERTVTSTIYGLIKDHRYSETVEVLTSSLIEFSKTRPMLSLLGFCHYQMQDFVCAADCYEELVSLYPSNDQYRLYFAQSLYKANLFEEAMKVSSQIENPDFSMKVKQLQAAIRFEQDDLISAKVLLDQCPPSDPDVIVNSGCILFKEGQYEEAIKKFSASAQLSPYEPRLMFNIALCQYMMKNYNEVLKIVSEIIQHSTAEYPEFKVHLHEAGVEGRSVGNSVALQKSALVEAFNLEMASYYMNKQLDESRSALSWMPPRNEQELDSVTLHNQALLALDINPSGSFEKLRFLLQQDPCPPETFPNLLIAFVKYDFHDIAADVLAENTHLAVKYLTSYQYDFLEAVITRQTSPEECYQKLDEMITKLLDSLKNGAKQIEEGKDAFDEEMVKKGFQRYDDALSKYIAVLMQQAKIHWDMEDYEKVENIFRNSYAVCGEDEVWKLNLAHVMFMQGNKFTDAASFYEVIIRKHYENLLDVSAIVLANLCSSYAIIGQMTEAEELIRKIEKEELRLAYEKPHKMSYHECIINLVLGTLYCSKGNYEFGILRIVHSLQPYSKKLGMETWYYTKRCFLSLIECLAKHMIVIKDKVLENCLRFLEECECHGFGVTTQNSSPSDDPVQMAKHTVAYEARILKSLLLQLM